MVFLWLKSRHVTWVAFRRGILETKALANAQEAIELYIESLEAHGDPIPPAITEEIVEINLNPKKTATQ